MKIKRTAAALFLALILLVVLAVPARGDMGPKPSITVTVENPPPGDYYLDLLVKRDAPYEMDEEKRAKYDPERLALLESFKEDGWFPALEYGFGAPIFGDLIGTPEGENRVHHFGYIVPSDFRLIIVTEEGEVVATDEIHTGVFDAKIRYDFATGTISQPSVLMAYLIQFGMTLLPTLLIEGVVLLLFGFSLKVNWKPFLVVNLSTQIFMTLALGSILVFGGMFGAYLVFLPIELVILITEAVAYARVLKGRSRARKMVYALVGNLASAAAGFALIAYESALLSGL